MEKKPREYDARTNLAEAQRRAEEANSQLYTAQERVLQQYVDKYSSELSTKLKQTFQSLPDSNARQNFLNRLEADLSRGAPLESGAGAQFVDLESAASLSEVVYKAVYYAKKKLQSDDALAKWMHRSRPTAFRIRTLAEKVFSGEASVDEFDKLDLRGKE